MFGGGRLGTGTCDGLGGSARLGIMCWRLGCGVCGWRGVPSPASY